MYHSIHSELLAATCFNKSWTAKAMLIVYNFQPVFDNACQLLVIASSWTNNNLGMMYTEC
jgi:hypothetical protein